MFRPTPILIIFFLSFFFLTSGDVFAHRLNVFAWVENENIMVKCDFGKNRPAMNISVTLSSLQTHEEIARAITNKNGECALSLGNVRKFPSGLLIEANAGQGHIGKWEISAAELASNDGNMSTKIDGISKQNNSDAVFHKKSRAQTKETAAQITVSPAELQAIIHAEIAPLQKEIASLAANDPRINEIIGGIGWIIGLVGMGLYFKARRH